MFRRHKALVGRMPGVRYHSSSNNASRISHRAQPRQPGSSFRPRRGSAGGSATPSSSALSHQQANLSHLPSVPILNTHPSIIVADAFFAGDRPLLELTVPPSQRRSVQQAQSQQQSLDELLDEALQWFDPKQATKEGVSSQNVAAEAQAELDKQTPFIPPQEPQRRKLSQRRRRLAPRHDAAQQFLQSMHQRLEHQDENARLALDKFFHSGQKLSELLPSAKQAKTGRSVRGRGKVLTAEDVQELLQITSAAMEHWSDENGSTKLFTMEKDPNTGVWTSTENANLPSSSTSKTAAPELDESDLVEEHVIVLDQHGRQQFLGGAAPHDDGGNVDDGASLAQAISQFVRSLPEDVALEGRSSSNSSLKPGQRPKGGTGRRITLGPRLLANRGGRSVPRVHRTLDQLLGWTSIRADSVKKKRRRKVSCAISEPLFSNLQLTLRSQMSKHKWV